MNIATYFLAVFTGDVADSRPDAGAVAAEDALVDAVTDGVFLDIPHPIQQPPAPKKVPSSVLFSLFSLFSLFFTVFAVQLSQSFTFSSNPVGNWVENR